MKSKLRTVFLKQECVTRSVFICLGLVALIGAIVILCDGYKGDLPWAISDYCQLFLYRGYRFCLSSSI